MIKGIHPNNQKKQDTEVGKPDAGAVPQDASERFSDLLHKKETPRLKELSKSKNKIDRFLNKMEDELTKQVGQDQMSVAKAKPSVHKQSTHSNPQPSDNQVGQDQMSVAKAKPSVHKQSTHFNPQPSDNKDLPQSLDAFDIASMIAQSQTPTQSTAPIEKAPPAPPADLNKIVGEIANRILVSSPADNPAGMQEIRIHLKESVLPNTEVRIYRHAGSLQVEFVTGTKDSQIFIEQRQPDIQKVLGERLTNETVNVSVQDSQQTRGGQGEGRSRQQYIYPEQDDD